MLKAFRTENPSLQALSASELKYCLTPAASIAWWICTFKPELLERTQLHLLLPGVSIIECADQGRWLQFIPWLVGQPNLAVSAALVGDELYVDADRRPSSGKGLSKKEQKKQWAINAEHLVKPKAPAQITNGTLADWNTFSNSLPDLCVLFAPGFASHYKTWLTEEDLLPLLRARVPTAVFYYSELDCVADSFILEACGLTQENTETKLNPWRQVHEREYETGGFAQFAGNLAVPNISYPLVFDKEKLKVFIQTESYLSAEYAEGGGDAALLRIGTKFIYEREGNTFSPPRVGHTQDYAFVLPYFLLIMESDGAVVYRAETEDGFVDTYQMRLPPALLIGWPFKNPFQRLIAAVHLHRDIIQPILKEMNPDVDADEEEELDFMLAMMGGDINLLTFFKQAISEMNGLPPKKKKDATKRKSFFRAIANADFDKAQALAAKNPALLHATDNEGKTALMRAYDADNTPLLVNSHRPKGRCF
ncbi:MAG: hypothetical protein Q7S87_10445 [Agitococcus sp.]|nr:hypothetical protein [Agitococcus sp.]